MKKIYTKKHAQIKLNGIVDLVLGMTEKPNEAIVDDMIYFLLNHFEIEQCIVDYSADLKNSSGVYHPDTKKIEIKISSLSHPISAFEVLAHEMAHKFDNEKCRITSMVDHKGTITSMYSAFPFFYPITLSQKLFNIPFKMYGEYYYYSNPTEIFARQESLKLTTKLLLECEKKCKTILDKSHQEEVKYNIKELKHIIKLQKKDEKKYHLYKALSTFSMPITKFIISRIGKQLYKQIKNNRVDENFKTNLSSWMITFETPKLQNEDSKKRLLEMVKLTKSNEEIYRTLYAHLQNLGFVDCSPKAVEKHMTDMMKNLRPEFREEWASSHWPNIYIAYDPEFIKSTATKVAENLYFESIEKQHIFEEKLQNKKSPSRERFVNELTLN